MITRIIAIIFIFVCTSIAWFALGTSVLFRTQEQDDKLQSTVGKIWGAPQRQKAPKIYLQSVKEKTVRTLQDDKTVTIIEKEIIKEPFSLDASNIHVDIHLDYRKKGLLWYSTYRVRFDGKYQIKNSSDQPQEVLINFELPSKDAVYDNFQFIIDGQPVDKIQPVAGILNQTLSLQPDEIKEFMISYGSQGLNEWWYDFGSDVHQAKNFQFIMNTDFDKIDFPENSLAPTQKIKSDTGWQLIWQYGNLLSGVQLGMVLPKKLNPGPWVGRVTFFAPVSLFLFFFLLLIFSTLRNIKIHPMNYFFLGAAFFSFHLLLAYLVDHISIHLAFIICSMVSIFLVISYMRLVVNPRFAFLEIGISQFVYLVLFSYAFFFEGYTGLAITILSILTLFIVMQYTGRVDWDKVFEKNNKSIPTPPKG